MEKEKKCVQEKELEIHQLRDEIAGLHSRQAELMKELRQINEESTNRREQLLSKDQLLQESQNKVEKFEKELSLLVRLLLVDNQLEGNDGFDETPA